MVFFDKKTICEICFNPECSDKGIRNVLRGYDTKSCVSFKNEDEASTVKKIEQTEADDVEWSTHYDPTQRDD